MTEAPPLSKHDLDMIDLAALANIVAPQLGRWHVRESQAAPHTREAAAIGPYGETYRAYDLHDLRRILDFLYNPKDDYCFRSYNAPYRPTL